MSLPLNFQYDFIKSDMNSLCLIALRQFYNNLNEKFNEIKHYLLAEVCIPQRTVCAAVQHWQEQCITSYCCRSNSHIVMHIIRTEHRSAKGPNTYPYAWQLQLSVLFRFQLFFYFEIVLILDYVSVFIFFQYYISLAFSRKRLKTQEHNKLK